MNTLAVPPTPTSLDAHSLEPTSPAQRFFGVVARPQSYRNIAYLLLGLPLGTAWFALLVSGVSVAISMLVVALLGIPMLVGIWYLTRALANVERAAANVLLDQDLVFAPMASGSRGNLWVRLRSLTTDRSRWREFGFLMLRFPAGVATFTVAVTALAAPVLVAYAPVAARTDDSHPFGDWALSARMESAASSPWSWLLVPLGLLLLFGSFHLMNVIARACGRWTAAWLDIERSASVKAG
jgi:hypothetical protein